jgi:hypothetical protein
MNHQCSCRYEVIPPWPAGGTRQVRHGQTATRGAGVIPDRPIIQVRPKALAHMRASTDPALLV